MRYGHNHVLLKRPAEDAVTGDTRSNLRRNFIIHGVKCTHIQVRCIDKILQVRSAIGKIKLVMTTVEKRIFKSAVSGYSNLIRGNCPVNSAFNLIITFRMVEL